MKKPLLVAMLVVGAARPAWPCGGDYDYRPSARLVLSEEETGLQPWIYTRNADARNVTFIAVTKQCADGERCEGDVVGYEMVGEYVRPSKPLAEGTRLQVMFGTKVIGDFTVHASTRTTLKDWKGLQLGAVSYEPLDGVTTVGMATPDGHDISNTMTFVYWSRPDPANLMKNVAEVREGTSGLEVRTSKRPKVGKPVQLWIVMTDADGHMTAPQKIL